MPRIYSIFSSLNGEICHAHQGSMCTFIRFAGCSQNCPWCDSEFAKDPNSGKKMSIDEILDTVKIFGNTNITITGGEPLEQMEGLYCLVYHLLTQEYQVSVETSGEISFNREHFELYKASFVVDIKLDTQNYLHDYLGMKLNDKDFFKIVIGSENDMIQAVHIKQELQHKGCKAKFAFSPMSGKIEPKQLLQWMKDYDQTDSILNLQLHKLLNLVEDC